MRVVVTGYGLITAAGGSAEECWNALNRSDSGIGQNTVVPMDGVSSDRAGQIRSLPEPDCPSKDRAVRLGEIALSEALERAGLSGSNPYLASRQLGLDDPVLVSTRDVAAASPNQVWGRVSAVEIPLTHEGTARTDVEVEGS